jgi:hypothetical protein
MRKKRFAPSNEQMAAATALAPLVLAATERMTKNEKTARLKALRAVHGTSWLARIKSGDAFTMYPSNQQIHEDELWKDPINMACIPISHRPTVYCPTAMKAHKRLMDKERIESYSEIGIVVCRNCKRLCDYVFEEK